jgi:hypothetical protein
MTTTATPLDQTRLLDVIFWEHEVDLARDYFIICYLVFIVVHHWLI